MTIDVDWVNRKVTVHKDELTLITGTLWQHDTVDFHNKLRVLEATEYGMSNSDIHSYIAGYTVAGDTYAPKVEMNYSIEYLEEAGVQSVKLVGSNNNLFDIQNGILIQNTVQVIPGNSAGLIITTVGSAVTAQDKTDIAALVAELEQVKRVYQRLGLDPLTPVTNKDDGGYEVDDVVVAGTSSGTDVIQTRTA